MCHVTTVVKMAPSHICLRLFAFCLLPFHGFHGLNGYRSFSDDRTSLTDEECGGFDNLSVHFGDYYFDCGQEVPLDQVNTQAPTVAYKKGVNLKVSINFFIKRIGTRAPSSFSLVQDGVLFFVDS